MEQEKTSGLPDVIQREADDNAENFGHAAISSHSVAPTSAEDWFAWLQVLGAFSLNLNTW